MREIIGSNNEFYWGLSVKYNVWKIFNLSEKL